MKQNVEAYKSRRARALKRAKFLYPLDRLSYRLYHALFERRLAALAAAVDPVRDRVLFLSPHQDDELLGCGGLLIHCHDLNVPIRVVFFIDGKGPAWLRSEEERVRLANTRVEESELVAAELGMDKPLNLRLDDTADNLDEQIARAVVEQVEDFSPTVVVIPFLADTHRQHLALTRSLAALDRGKWSSLKVLMYRTHGLIPSGLTNTYFGLTTSLEQRKESLLCHYRTQKLHLDITRQKYLLYSKCVPASLSGKFGSVERFCGVSLDGFHRLDSLYENSVISERMQGINYAPYSFVRFFFNKLLFLSSSFGRQRLISEDV